MRNVPIFLSAWGPPTLWAWVIFLLSTNLGSADNTRSFFEPLLRAFFPGISEAAVELAHETMRKAAHVTEYFIFAWLLDRGFRQGSSAPRVVAPLYALAIAALYSLTDEWHQSWVASRTPSLADCGFDSLGALVAAVWRRRG